MKRGWIIFLITGFIAVLLTPGCSKLNESPGGNLTPDQIAASNSAASQLLQGVYSSLSFTFTSNLEIFAASELTTDEAIAPTRGNNWDDNGGWRVMHEQKYDPNSTVLANCFQHLGGVIFAATDLLQTQYHATTAQQAEARFLRAWAMYWMLDMYDEVPYRDPGESVIPAARVRKGMDAFNYIISELYAIEPDLTDDNINMANRSAAQVLLMKCYLNKAVYSNRASPAFDAADMNKVISFADTIIGKRFSFSANYFDNFSTNNGQIGLENIFTQPANFDFSYAVAYTWILPLEYNQYPMFKFATSNGFTTLPEFYNRFDSTDIRRGTYYVYPSSLPNTGHHVNVGFLIGQQYDLTVDTPLSDDIWPLIYTPEIQNILPGPNLLMPGIRPIKYAPDIDNFYYFPPPANQYVYFRLPDVLLMKAEAILRGGTPTAAGPYGDNPLDLVNSIRTHPSRGVAALTSVTLDSLLVERGKELWWENWRRQDMIRFGTYLLPFGPTKDYTSDPHYLVFPIPYQQLAVNSNLTQNPGY